MSSPAVPCSQADRKNELGSMFTYLILFDPSDPCNPLSFQSGVGYLANRCSFLLGPSNPSMEQAPSILDKSLQINFAAETRL